MSILVTSKTKLLVQGITGSFGARHTQLSLAYGTQVVAGKILSKKYPDVVVGNKKGIFVFIHQTKEVSHEEWEKAQPKVTNP